MKKPTVIHSENAAEDNAEAIENWSKMEKLAAELRNVQTIDMDRNDEDERKQVQDYTAAATSGLKAILARAAIEDAKARGRG